MLPPIIDRDPGDECDSMRDDERFEGVPNYDPPDVDSRDEHDWSL